MVEAASIAIIPLLMLMLFAGVWAVVNQLALGAKGLSKISALQIAPNPGESWALSPDESPWPKQIAPVIVIEIKDGWVRYIYHPDDKTGDSCKLETFLAVYRRFSP